MRISNAEHEAGPWRIREIATGFELEDAWDLPVEGSADDFQLFLEDFVTGNPSNELSLPSRVLWWIRDALGRLGIGRIATAGAAPPDDRSLAGRVPADLRGSADDLRFDELPFTSLYRTPTEFAAELSNRLVHAILHLAWVDLGDGRRRGRMGVYVRPRSRAGAAYMAAIKPFRLWIVYPSLMRVLADGWRERTAR